MIGWTTTETRDDAQTLAAKLIDARLAACVQIDGPITSCYHWQGQVQRDEEYRLAVKFIQTREAEVRDFIEKHHPYDTPQWLALRADTASEAYEKWAQDECGGA